MKSKREKETNAHPYDRTVDDYLVIISEDPDVCFGEYDNYGTLCGMIRDGLIIWRPDKPNRADNMVVSLWPVLTDAGRALAGGK